jgi:hypothetical protein
MEKVGVMPKTRWVKISKYDMLKRVLTETMSLDKIMMKKIHVEQF